tara:strand:- start:177 stop:503 length:327 start_codon:yes stop_codon:yes gene_type:complete
MINSKSKKILLWQRLFIWFLYLSSGYILYFKNGYLFSFFLALAKVIYPLSIFWLQIRIKKRVNFLPIDSKMTTSELWFTILPILACLITVIITILNAFLYFSDTLITD